MTLKKINPTQTKSWKKLNAHFKIIKNKKIKSLLKERNNPDNFNVTWEDFNVDLSKNIIDDTTLDLLLQLAEECELSDSISKQFCGQVINETENRAVLHTAVRSLKNSEIKLDGVNIIPSLEKTREKIKDFTNNVLSGKLKGSTNKKFTDIVNIGIGGSDLGPVMIVEALKYYSTNLKTHFVSNVDGDHV